MPGILAAYGLVTGVAATGLVVALIAGELVCGVWFLARPRSKALAPVWVFTAVSVVWSLLAVQAYARGLTLANCGCEALDDAAVSVMSRADVHRFLLADVHISARITAILGRRLEQRLSDSVFKSVAQRIATTLVILTTAQPQPGPLRPGARRSPSPTNNSPPWPAPSARPAPKSCASTRTTACCAWLGAASLSWTRPG